MLLSEYFEDYFYSLKQLAQYCSVSEECLLQWQSDCLLPNAAYHIKNQVQSSSFFGLHDFTEEKEYYPRGYTKWIDTIKHLESPSSAQAFTLFYQQYAKTINDLVSSGVAIDNEYFESFEENIQNQWQFFLAGKYGVITANGFIHEIAALELAEYLACQEDTDDQQTKHCIRLFERNLCFAPKQLNFTSNAHQTLERLKAG